MDRSSDQRMIRQLHEVSRGHTTVFMSFGLTDVVNTVVDLGGFSLGYCLLNLSIFRTTLCSWLIAVTLLLSPKLQDYVLD